MREGENVHPGLIRAHTVRRYWVVPYARPNIFRSIPNYKSATHSSPTAAIMKTNNKQQ
jgi:hypothetical protein